MQKRWDSPNWSDKTVRWQTETTQAKRMAPEVGLAGLWSAAKFKISIFLSKSSKHGPTPPLQFSAFCWQFCWQFFSTKKGPFLSQPRAQFRTETPSQKPRFSESSTIQTTEGAIAPRSVQTPENSPSPRPKVDRRRSNSGRGSSSAKSFRGERACRKPWRSTNRPQESRGSSAKPGAP